METTSALQVLVHFDRHLGGLIAQYGGLVYAMLFAIIFCEIGLLPLFFLPGDPLLFLCGAFCATGALSVGVVVPLLFVAAVAGSLLNYCIGRAIGRQLHGARHRWIDRDALRRTQAFYAEHGGVTFLLSPFLAVIRTFAPFVAGACAMPPARFMASVLAGAALWVVALVLAGYFFGNVPVIRDHMSTIVLLGIALGVGGLLAGGAWRRLRARRPG